MIFIDHIPNNFLDNITMRNFGFSDAAEVFVLLAGFSSVMAYGRVFERDGTRSGLRRILLRLGRLYLFQIGLLLITLVVVLAWTTHYNLQPTIVAPILNKPVTGLAHALALHAISELS
ncbi:MAG: OpgC domain-containing protein [Rhodomicrobium sp.]